MSDSQAYEEVNIASDGVNVTKRFEEDEFPVPAIAFEFSSERDEMVTVRLSDVVPEGVEVEDLGFHPEYGSEYWTIDDDTIAFAKELEADGEYTTVYGIRATGTDDVEQFLTKPAIDEVDPPLPESEKSDEDGEVIPESDDDVVRDVIAGEGDVPGLEEEDEEGEETDESVETLDLKDPNAAEEATSTAESEEGGEADVSVEGSVVTAMANEIRENNVSVDDLKLLDRAFQKVSGRSETVTTGESGGATDARVQKIQSDVADLRAYTDALEGFLEENGTGQQLISEFEDRLDEVASDLDSMQSDVESVTDEVDSVSNDVDSVSEDVDDIGSEVSSLGDEVDSVSSDVSSVESTVEEIDTAVGTLEEALKELESEVSDGEVVERIESIEQDISELKEWQDQIKSTFGG